MADPPRRHVATTQHEKAAATVREARTRAAAADAGRDPPSAAVDGRPERRGRRPAGRASRAEPTRRARSAGRPGPARSRAAGGDAGSRRRPRAAARRPDRPPPAARRGRRPPRARGRDGRGRAAARAGAQPRDWRAAERGPFRRPSRRARHRRAGPSRRASGPAPRPEIARRGRQPRAAADDRRPARCAARAARGSGGRGRRRELEQAHVSQHRRPQPDAQRHPVPEPALPPPRRAEVARRRPSRRGPSLRKVRRGPRAAPRPSSTRRRRTRKATAAAPAAGCARPKRPRSCASSRVEARAAPSQELARAAEAVNAGHERDAARILRPLRDAYPDAAAVRELLGLVPLPARASIRPRREELGTFADLTGSVEQHPVLMDCARAQKKYAQGRVALGGARARRRRRPRSCPKGRIVMAGSLADRGRLRDAVAMLERRGGNVQRPAEHHLRVWYALADLCERSRRPAARARALRSGAHAATPAFADVAERLLALG